MSGVQHKGGKKNRKYGRNKKWCESYRKRGQREINKKRKIRTHMKKFPNDRVAERALALFS